MSFAAASVEFQSALINEMPGGCDRNMRTTRLHTDVEHNTVCTIRTRAYLLINSSYITALLLKERLALTWTLDQQVNYLPKETTVIHYSSFASSELFTGRASGFITV